MSKKMIGLALSLIVSVGIGLLAGQKFYGIFANTVPPGCVSNALLVTAHGAYIGLGAVLGVVIFGWTAAAAWLAKFFPASASTTSSK
jgi:hypothetical protein